MAYSRINSDIRTPVFRVVRIFCTPALLSGIVIGFTVSYVFFLILHPNYGDNETLSLNKLDFTANKKVYFNSTHRESDIIHAMLNKTVAHQLFAEVKVLCWVTTSPDNHEKRAQHVKATWGRRCNILVFISTKEDNDLPTIVLSLPEGRNYLWAKTKKALEYLYAFYYEQADWFLKADDDTYVIVENLRYMLYTENPEAPVYYGCRFKPYVTSGYMSGGAGYVLSREALRKVVTEAIPNKTLCKEGHEGNEDVEIGRCLEGIGIKPGDSRDQEGRMRFMPLNVNNFIYPGNVPKNSWFWKYIYYPVEEGIGCCSDVAVTIHYVKRNEMYLFDYFLYHLRPFGIGFEPRLPQKNISITII